MRENVVLIGSKGKKGELSRRDDAARLRLNAIDQALRKWHDETAGAALAFESRWTLLALRQANADIAERLFDQCDKFARACVTGTVQDIEIEGAALCRDYALAAATLQALNVEDDAYIIGRCPTTGTTVAISRDRAAVARVRDLFGDQVIWMTPDEIATLMAKASQFRAVAAVKQQFPGAEVTERYATELREPK